ncbi:hypothetical protein [Vagococcus hydrophili]|uniref:Uncharacterized protein n=1 Tax=Vagococcus hydrophili TaxID=2714947 RepID=A0A6G8AU76_9ENTE|nr:hypothetical protein [Vagococcus hydrophili]QIL48495.1 hypothetical protein G7082_08275 [Vagococcus hydrophili]
MMEERYDQNEVEELFSGVMSEVEMAEISFEKSLYFKQLSYSEQKASRDIIYYLGEFMFDYHLESLSTWSKVALEDVLISVFPTKIVANRDFFKRVEPVLVKFFEFLCYSEKQTKALELIERIQIVSELMLNEVEIVLKNSNEVKVMDLGVEMGLDMSDLSELDRLYKFVDLFETSKKKE